MEKEEKALREFPGDALTPDRLFENHAGHFWGILVTRDYMRARYHFVDATLQNFGKAGGYFDTVHSSAEHLRDMMRLCRSDNMGLRDQLPALYIRLGREQEAYDLMRWYATTGERSDYDWGDLDLPIHDTKGANMWEAPPEPWLRPNFLDLSHALGVFLIKMRGLMSLQDLQSATRALRGDRWPQEIIEEVRTHLLGHGFSRRREILRMSEEHISAMIEETKAHLRDLHETITKYNPHVMMLLEDDPDGAAASRPGSYSMGTEEEACLVISYNLEAWKETPGSFEMLQEIGDELYEYVEQHERRHPPEASEDGPAFE